MSEATAPIMRRAHGWRLAGDDIHPLYAQLTSMPEPIGGDVQWNFQKYLVSRDGEVAAKFNPTVTPDDPDLVTKIEELLG